ncbi:protein of unknown function [Candidatus Filomicrobium marinum]|uniref:Uncharacterized protein n=1 Tax=Candidatus Filomicrobium marinum TaxID=1608628 RepID=A0A0D6JK97_9HYPH|nr:protein of unknown function [Candidatus Filomicrobium marinum]CPR22384.1 protein of unknown function [Candidatus Filomicrobium marinum]
MTRLCRHSCAELEQDPSLLRHALMVVNPPDRFMHTYKPFADGAQHRRSPSRGAQVAHEIQAQESPAGTWLLNLLIFLDKFGCGGRI